MSERGTHSFTINGFPALESEIAALKRQLAEAQVSAVQPCGHHMSLRIKSVESDYEFCELCEARHMQRDAETAESNYRAQRDTLRARVETLEAALRGALRALAYGTAVGWDIVRWEGLLGGYKAVYDRAALAGKE